MKRWVFLVLFAAAGFGQDGVYDEKKFEALKDKLLKKDEEDQWKKIRWAESFEAALKRATDEQKPVYVFLVVGHLGQKSSTEC